MKLKTYSPQAIEVWYILPAIRREFVKELVKTGLSQRAAAEKLGLTEGAVSLYLKDKRAKEVVFEGEIKREIRKSAMAILDGRSVMKETQRICRLAERDMLVCKISKKLGFAPRRCRECFK